MKSIFRKIIFGEKHTIHALQQYFVEKTGAEVPVLSKDNSINDPFAIIKESRSVIKIEGTHVISNSNKSKAQSSVLAIITTYNEEDILGQTIKHYINNDVDVYIIDNHSTDGTSEICHSLMKKYPKNVHYEKFPAKTKRKGEYKWEELLKRKDEIAANSKYDWVIHCDSDEIRVSPNKDISLQKYITAVDRLGYNAIDFTVLDFRPTEDGFDGSQGVDRFFRYFEFGKRPGHFRQVKGWKNQGTLVNLHVGGGHNPDIKNIKIYPLKFLLKHYSIRSSKHAQRKLFKERKPTKKALRDGWHSHHRMLRKRDDFIWPKKGLIYYDEERFYNQYHVERLTGVGIPRK